MESASETGTLDDQPPALDSSSHSHSYTTTSQIPRWLSVHSKRTSILIKQWCWSGTFHSGSCRSMFFRIPEAGGGLCGCHCLVGPAQLFPLVSLSQAKPPVPIIVSPHEMADKMMRMPLHCCCTSAVVDQCRANRALHSTLLSCTVGTGVKPSVHQ